MFWFTKSSYLIANATMLVNASILGVVAWEEMQSILKLGQKWLIPVPFNGKSSGHFMGSAVSQDTGIQENHRERACQILFSLRIVPWVL